jgi:hypothetical protein
MTTPIPSPSPDLREVITITAGTRHANVIPVPPDGRKIERIWTVIDLEKLSAFGPLHNVSAFLEDPIHDYFFDHAGQLHYFSRVAATDAPVDIVLDYETAAEIRARQGLPPRRPRPGR